MSVRRLSNLKRSLSSASSSASRLVTRQTRFQDPDLVELTIGAEIEVTAAVSGVVPDDTFSVAQAVNALGFGPFQLVLSFVIGLCWMSEAIELMILSILSPALQCEWGISQYQQAFLTTVVFIGMTVSSTLWGKFSDHCGRRQALVISSFFLFFYGLLSAFAPSYNWMLFLRFLVGFNIGCVPQSVTLYSEFLPTAHRARCVVLLDCFWALGALAEVVLAAVVVPIGGWRVLLALSALPALVFTWLASVWLPESARFNAATGNTDAALETLELVAERNKKPMLLGRLIVDDDSFYLQARGQFSDLLGPELRRTTLSLWIIWTACSFVYYGMVLMTTELFESPGGNTCALDGSLQQTCSAQCSSLAPIDYVHLLWTTMAEFPGILLTFALMEKLGRTRTLTLQFVLLALTLSVLFHCTSDKVLVSMVLFAIRGVASGAFQAAFVYTPEVYPTVLRSIGVGSCSGMARAGAMITPYIAQVLMKSSLASAVTVYVAVCVVATITCYFLPMETRGKELRDKQGQISETVQP